MSRTRLLEETKIGMAITQRMLKTAQKFADCQFSEADSKRVYFNTIAVLAVNNYLQMMEIPTDLKQSDSLDSNAGRHRSRRLDATWDWFSRMPSPS